MKSKTILSILATLAILAIASSPALADVGLAVICTSATAPGSAVGACTAEKYDKVGASDLVRVCLPPKADGSSGCDWSLPSFVYQVFSSLSATTYIDSCKTDIPTGTIAPHPWSSAADPCKSWMGVLKPLIPTMSVIVPGTNNSAVLAWTAPASCADGSALTNCAITAYNVYKGATPTSMAKITTLGPAVLTYTDAGLPAGQVCYGVSASSASAEGAIAGGICKIVAVPALGPGSITGFTFTLTTQ